MSKNSSIQTFFSKCTWNVLQNRSHVKRIKIIPSIFSNHNNMKLEVNYRTKNGKRTHTRRLNDMLLKKQWVNKEIKNPNENKRQGFPDGSVEKILPASAGDVGSIPGPGRSHVPRSNSPIWHNYLACALESRHHNCSACMPEPVIHNERSHCSEKPTHRNKEYPPLTAARESLRTAMKIQHSQCINKILS